jgi:hypothetical protein
MIAMDKPSRDVSRARGPQLRQAGDEALPFAELHAARITFPAAVVSELELNGYVMQRVYEHGRLVGVRLLEPEPPGHILGAPLAQVTPIADRSTARDDRGLPGLG